MTEPEIACPNCHHTIKLTQSLAGPMLATARLDFEQRLAAQDTAIAAERAALADARNDIDKEVSARLKGVRDGIASEEARKARELVASELEDRNRALAHLEAVGKQRDIKLVEAQAAQAEMLRKERALEDRTRELDLTIEKRVNDNLISIRDKARKDAEDTLQLKVRERDEQILAMQKQIEELRRRSEQGSQQLQGEVQELELESLLSARFPGDTIEPVPKGVFGGDVLHRIAGPGGVICGTILWETKRTKNWTQGWLAKLRDDQRSAKADIALLVSHTLPPGMETSFDLVHGIWVTEPRCALPVAVAVRETIIKLAAARQASEGQSTKMSLVYDYLTGSLFRQRIEAVVERFSDMRADLDSERKAMTRLWAKREKQIESVMLQTAGLYGDLQGIAGRSLGEIAGLELARLAPPSDDAPPNA